jgi:hypothetical protein
MCGTSSCFKLIKFDISLKKKKKKAGGYAPCLEKEKVKSVYTYLVSCLD